MTTTVMILNQGPQKVEVSILDSTQTSMSLDPKVTGTFKVWKQQSLVVKEIQEPVVDTSCSH